MVPKPSHSKSLKFSCEVLSENIFHFFSIVIGSLVENAPSELCAGGLSKNTKIV